jgi:hypothetical protein
MNTRDESWVARIMEATPREELERQAEIDRSHRNQNALILLAGVLLSFLIFLATVAGLSYAHWKHLIF